MVNITASPFTGLFKNGLTHGLIRLSLAGPINKTSGIGSGGAVKFFRSGRSSANFVFMDSIKLIGHNNFFAVTMTNHLPAGFPANLGPKFCQAQRCINKVGLSDVCTYDQDGEKVNNVIFPFLAAFVPTGDIRFREDYSELPEFLKQFTDLPNGTILYRLKGHQNPNDKLGVNLGEVVTTDKCISSDFGDNKIFFRHQPIEEDKELMPEWADSYDKDCDSHLCNIPFGTPPMPNCVNCA